MTKCIIQLFRFFIISVRKQNVVYIWFQLREKMFRGCENKVKLLQSS